MIRSTQHHPTTHPRTNLPRLLRAVAMLPLILTAAPASAQPNDLEGLRRAYDDTLAQLRSAQDRKNELAIENEKLRAEISALQTQLTTQQQKAATLQSQLDVLLDRSYSARATQAAFSAFLRANPDARKLWELHFAASFPKLDE